MKDLYFEDRFGELQPVVKDMEDNTEAILMAVYKDLYKRRPEIISYYQRVCFLEGGDLLIDFGSHTEFYIAKNKAKESNDGKHE